MKRARLPLISLLLFVPLIGAGLLLAPEAVSAQIIVSGPPTPTAHELTDWFARHIPAKFQAHGRLEVEALDDAEMDAYVHQNDTSDSNQNSQDDDGDIDGVFSDNPPQIMLRVPEGGKPDFETLAHEYGHYLWFDLFSKDDRRHYEAIYKTQKSAHKLITEYAATGVEEGFAEAFAAFINDPAALRHQDPLSFQFLTRRPSAAP